MAFDMEAESYLYITGVQRMRSNCEKDEVHTKMRKPHTIVRSVMPRVQLVDLVRIENANSTFVQSDGVLLDVLLNCFSYHDPRQCCRN